MKIQQCGPQCRRKEKKSYAHSRVSHLCEPLPHSRVGGSRLDQMKHYVFIHGSHENTALLPLGANEIMSVTKDLYNGNKLCPLSPLTDLSSRAFTSRNPCFF